MKYLFVVLLIIVNTSAATADVVQTVCSDVDKEVMQFRYILTVAGAELPLDQQELGQKFLSLLDNAPKIVCMESQKKTSITLTGQSESVTGLMSFDDIGQVESLSFQ